MGRKVLVLGATGGMGRHIVSQALRQGHDVTVLARDAQKVSRTGGGMPRVITGSVPEDEQALDSAIQGQEVVISALGVGPSLKSGGLLRRSVPAILRAMEAHGVRRLILTSSYGVGDTHQDVPLLPRIVMRLLFQDLFADKKAGDDAVRSSSVDWTIVHPVTLTDGARTGRYRVGERLSLSGFPRVSRADVADFILTQIDDRSHVRKSVLISG